MLRRLVVATSFLTRVPIPGGATADAADLARATMLFPVVGAAVGAVLAGAGQLAVHVLPPVVAAVLVVGLSALLTGALHLDGLADTVDGLGGGRTPEDALRIMRDHAIGAYGAVALALLLALKIAALAELFAVRGAAAPLVAAAALGRWTALPLAFALPYARVEGGLGSAVAGRVSAASLVVGTARAVGGTLAVAGPRVGAAYAAAGAAVAMTMGAVYRRRLGGVTGDTLGATTELVEAAVYVVAVSLR